MRFLFQAACRQTPSLLLSARRSLFLSSTNHGFCTAALKARDIFSPWERATTHTQGWKPGSGGHYHNGVLVLLSPVFFGSFGVFSKPSSSH